MEAQETPIKKIELDLQLVPAEAASLLVETIYYTQMNLQHIEEAMEKGEADSTAMYMLQESFARNSYHTYGVTNALIAMAGTLNDEDMDLFIDELNQIKNATFKACDELLEEGFSEPDVHRDWATLYSSPKQN